tara:strand:- start:697 stop:1395 length:699 start_codon:yes stop_codon:yes gene_type:complete
MDKDRIDLKDYTANLNADIPARTCVAYISTDTVDEEGEVVLPSGIQTNRFKSTGTVFWNHDYADPVATCEWLEMTDRGVVASTYFPKRPEGHQGEWRPDAVLSLVAAGLCRGVSIGFSYLETRQPTQKDYKQFKTTGNELKRVVSKSRLLEYSLAPLPMNEDALVVAARRGFLKKDGSIDYRAVKACRLELDGGSIKKRSIKLLPENKLKLKPIDTAKMTRIEIQKMQGRVY